MRKYDNTFGLISGNDYYENDEYIWMCLAWGNAICRVSKKSGRAEVVSQYPNTACGKHNLSGSIQVVDDQVVFCPFSADYIAICNMIGRNVRYIKLKKKFAVSGVNYSSDGKFFNSFRFGRYVYLFGWTYPAIVEINMDTLNVNYIDEWVEEVVRKKGFEPSNSYFNEGGAIIDERVYLPMGCLSALFSFDLNRRKGEIIEIKETEGGFWGLTRCGANMWLTGVNGGIYKYDIENRKIDSLEAPINVSYRAPVVCNNNKLFFFAEGTKSFFYDADRGEWEESNRINNIIHSGNFLTTVKYEKNLLKFVTKRTREWYSFHMEQKLVEKETYFLEDDDFLQKCWKSRCEDVNRKMYFVNEREIGLDEFISCLTNS
ncbi:MAG: hypothetical protein IKI75_05715 [Lachnospiraceae bacterium]|nr:hypothetical protein [Lachnospiraceae bacterium]